MKLLQAMWLMLQQEEAENFVIATNETHSVREFVELAFSFVDKPIRWEGSGLNEIGKEIETGIIRVRVNEKYFRPTEVVSFSYFKIQSSINFSKSFYTIQVFKILGSMTERLEINLDGVFFKLKILDLMKMQILN